jgi:hypothetical protein
VAKRIDFYLHCKTKIHTFAAKLFIIHDGLTPPAATLAIPYTSSLAEARKGSQCAAGTYIVKVGSKVGKVVKQHNK